MFKGCFLIVEVVFVLGWSTWIVETKFGSHFGFLFFVIFIHLIGMFNKLTIIADYAEAQLAATRKIADAAEEQLAATRNLALLVQAQTYAIHLMLDDAHSAASGD